MTLQIIKEHFEGDNDLLKYFDPESKAATIEEAVLEIHKKIIEFDEQYKCEFKTNEEGYIFYMDHTLISFCVKPIYRTKKNLIKFGEFIKANLGHHFECYLYEKNARGINFLKKIGMHSQQSKIDFITRLYI